MWNRRRVLNRSAQVLALIGSAGLLPSAAQAAYNASAFDAKSMADLSRRLGSGVPTESREVILTAPDVAENGAAVPISVATTLAGARRLLILVERNPNLLAALFELGDSVEPNLSTRIKMGQSSMVYAVALMADGRTLYAQKDVRVTLGGCAG